jgi:hypothetical protein
MHLVYLDESGNTGTDLKNAQQPVFVLAALVVPETCWQTLEKDLEAAIKTAIPSASDELEVHGTDLRNGSGQFKGVQLDVRTKLRNEWLTVARKHPVKVIYRAIVKRRFETWVQGTFGAGVLINPHVAAFALVSRVVNEYLTSLTPRALGMFISDENKEIVHDVEKSIKVLRAVTGTLQLSQIVEKGFFIDSRKSRVLQLCDVCALSTRKKEEAKAGLTIKHHDQEGVDLVEPLIYRGNEALLDVLAWLAAQQPKPTAASHEKPEKPPAKRGRKKGAARDRSPEVG